MPIFKVKKTESKNDANIVGVVYRVFGTSKCSATNNVIENEAIINESASSLITGNAINEAGLETDLSQILEPDLVVDNSNDNASRDNVVTTPTNESLNEQADNVEKEIDEVEDLEDVKAIYKKRKGKELEEDKEDFEEVMEANKEKEKLEEEAIEINAVSKILMLLSPGWNG